MTYSRGSYTVHTNDLIEVHKNFCAYHLVCIVESEQVVAQIKPACTIAHVLFGN